VKINKAAKESPNSFIFAAAAPLAGKLSLRALPLFALFSRADVLRRRGGLTAVVYA